MSHTNYKVHARKEQSLKEICFQAVRKHFDALGTASLVDLPAQLLEDLLPHLTVCQLDELQPVLNHRGISTLSGWMGVLSDLCGPNQVVDVTSEDQAKHKVMKLLFNAVFYGFTNSFIRKNLSNLNTPSFLNVAAKYLRRFSLLSVHKPLQALTLEKRSFLTHLEECIDSVVVSQSVAVSKKEAQIVLYILHCLLDHGAAREVIVNVHCPVILAWLLHERGPQHFLPQLWSLRSSEQPSSSHSQKVEEQHDPEVPCKLRKLKSDVAETLDPQLLCRRFGSCAGASAGPCPRGRIEHLEVSQWRPTGLTVLTAALPTFFCLRSLKLHNFSTFTSVDAMLVARALRQLEESSHSSLRELSISTLPCLELLEVLLAASPKLTSLQVEVQSVWGSPCFSACPGWTSEPELPLRTLTVKVGGSQTEAELMTRVLQRAPHLTSFHLCGVRLATGRSQAELLSTLSESNRVLRSLILEDMKLSDCLPQIQKLLRSCSLEELHLTDCRLLEDCSDKDESLRQLVSSLRTLSSLHTLCLPQNRLAKHVVVLADLFSSCPTSSLRRLDISSNFIQPAELLEFARRLNKHPPPHRLTLDLRKNPSDRAPSVWKAALQLLRPCYLLLSGWTNTHTMADHISNM